MWHELGETLLALVESFDAPASSGLVITGVEVDLPLEVGAAVHNGHLVFLASPPFTRYRSGVLPSVHKSHMIFELIEADNAKGD